MLRPRIYAQSRALLGDRVVHAGFAIRCTVHSAPNACVVDPIHLIDAIHAVRM